MSQGAQAAWVQAIGSIVAILVAVAVPVRIEKLKLRREDHLARLRARARALDVLSDLQELAAKADALIEMYEEPQWAPTFDVMALLTPSQALREQSNTRMNLVTLRNHCKIIWLFSFKREMLTSTFKKCRKKAMIWDIPLWMKWGVASARFAVPLVSQ